jgi:hypothetical protein
MLSIEEGFIVFTGKPARLTGTVRYSPPFSVAIEDIRIVGYAPRLIIDDESGFVILIDRKCKVYYFNTGLVASEEIRLLEKQFGFSLRYDTSNYSYEDYKAAITEVMYPAELLRKPLFKSWSWFSPRGFMKNIGYRMAMDNPMWERITEEMKAYVNRPNFNKAA